MQSAQAGREPRAGQRANIGSRERFQWLQLGVVGHWHAGRLALHTGSSAARQRLTVAAGSGAAGEAALALGALLLSWVDEGGGGEGADRAGGAALVAARGAVEGGRAPAATGCRGWALCLLGGVADHAAAQSTAQCRFILYGEGSTGYGASGFSCRCPGPPNRQLMTGALRHP